LIRERKNLFVEGDMARDINTLGGDVITSITFVFGGIADENAGDRAWG
jgi:hypothetical protein